MSTSTGTTIIFNHAVSSFLYPLLACVCISSSRCLLCPSWLFMLLALSKSIRAPYSLPGTSAWPGQFLHTRKYISPWNILETNWGRINNELCYDESCESKNSACCQFVRESQQFLMILAGEQHPLLQSPQGLFCTQQCQHVLYTAIKPIPKNVSFQSITKVL